jgi:hypothetical protein
VYGFCVITRRLCTSARIKASGNAPYLTAWSRVLPEKLTGPQPVKKAPHFMEPEGSGPHSQSAATCTRP